MKLWRDSAAKVWTTQSSFMTTVNFKICVCLQSEIRCTKDGKWTADFTMCSGLQGSCSAPPDLNSVEYSCDQEMDVGEHNRLSESLIHQINIPDYICFLLSNKIKPYTVACWFLAWLVTHLTEQTKQLWQYSIFLSTLIFFSSSHTHSPPFPIFYA